MINPIAGSQRCAAKEDEIQCNRPWSIRNLPVLLLLLLQFLATLLLRRESKEVKVLKIAKKSSYFVTSKSTRFCNYLGSIQHWVDPQVTTVSGSCIYQMRQLRVSTTTSDTERFETTGASIHTLSVGLLQRCTNRNSCHSHKTAAISIEYSGWFGQN